MTTTEVAPSHATNRVPVTVRAAQVLLLLPLGMLQFVAATAFIIADGVHGPRDCIVAAWVLVMAPCSAVLALRLGRPQARLLQVSLLLLAAQSAFSVVKLAVYHESASLVFFAFIAACVGLLVLPASRRHFLN